MFIMLCGRPPFNGKNDQEIYAKIDRGQFSFDRTYFPHISPVGPEWKLVSPEAKNLITRMLAYKPERRITAAAALSDPWISEWAASKSAALTSSAEGVLKSLRNFKVHAKLQQAVMAYMATYLQCKETEEKMRAAFRGFDKNGDGLLERGELVEGYMKTGLGRLEAQRVVDKIMATVDLNKNGTIDYSEFLMANLNKEELLSQEKLKEAFRLFDKVPNRT